MNQTPSTRDEPPTEWPVPVFNVLTNKRGTLLVQASAGQVVLVPPPGTGFIVPSASLPILRDAVNVAEAIAELQAKTLRNIALLRDAERRQDDER
jgi:hypothetical protein